MNNDMVEAMRRMRKRFWLLILAAVSLIGLILLPALGKLAIPLGWAGFIVCLISANRILRCPSCKARLPSIYQKVCPRCGVVLTDQPMLPNTAGPIPAEAQSFMDRSRQILKRWARIRAALRISIFAVGGLAAIGVFITAPDSSIIERVVISLFLGVVVLTAAWLVLVLGLDSLFGVVFLIFRGKCPLCGARFNVPNSFGPGPIELDYSLPVYCGSCGGRLG